MPVFGECGVQASVFGLHTSQQKPSEFVERGLGGDPNLRQRDGRLLDGAGPDVIGLLLSQPQGALRTPETRTSHGWESTLRSSHGRLRPRHAVATATVRIASNTAAATASR